VAHGFTTAKSISPFMILSAHIIISKTQNGTANRKNLTLAKNVVNILASVRSNRPSLAKYADKCLVSAKNSLVKNANSYRAFVLKKQK
jgi:hypothetical protein